MAGESGLADQPRGPLRRGLYLRRDYGSYITGVVKCPMTWVYWTSPKIVAI